MYFIPKYILILFLLIVIDYSAALLIHRAKGVQRKMMLIVSILANISLLAYFKYFTLAVDSLQEVFNWLHVAKTVPHWTIILPIGLSFHTFQSMAYTIEVYRGNQQPEKHLGIFSVYVLFFPQMVAGPIERFAALGNQFKQHHSFDLNNIINGIRLIVFGLFIKMAVADQIAPLVDMIYSAPIQYNNLSVLTGMVLFSLQIYADFWGYSTIAIGSAGMMGITLMDNFKAPYLATGISSFWNRWHISLSTWFKDYVYISLGGNRTSIIRWCSTIFIVFALSGLWHGANWTFLVWGLIHASLYLIERFWTTLFPVTSNRFVICISWLFTFLGVTIAWVFFRSHSFHQAFLILKQLTIVNGYSLTLTWKVLLACFLFVSADIILAGKRFDHYIQHQPILVRWFMYTVLLFGITIMAAGEEQPFIYFQF